jgi:hypothetical protein
MDIDTQHQKIFAAMAVASGHGIMCVREHLKEYSEDAEIQNLDCTDALAIVYCLDTVIAFNSVALAYIKMRIQTDPRGTVAFFNDRYYSRIDTEEPTKQTVSTLRGKCTRAKIPPEWANIVFADPARVRSLIAIMDLS